MTRLQMSQNLANKKVENCPKSLFVMMDFDYKIFLQRPAWRPLNSRRGLTKETSSHNHGSVGASIDRSFGPSCHLYTWSFLDSEMDPTKTASSTIKSTRRCITANGGAPSCKSLIFF